MTKLGLNHMYQNYDLVRSKYQNHDLLRTKLPKLFRKAINTIITCY